jgi:hypothetical protein
MIRGDKEKVSLYLSGGVMKRFRDWCFIKHGSIYGALSFELENAMNAWLAVSKDQGSTHTRYGTRAIELNRKIIDCLKKEYRYETLSGVTIAKSQLDEAILAIDGCTDRRSINDRIKLLKSKRCIKEAEDSTRMYKRYKFLSDSEYLEKEQMQ